MKRSNPSLHSGFILLELIVCIGLSMLALVAYSQYAAGYADRKVNNATAQHQKKIIEYAQKYIEENNDSLLAAATTTVPVIITTAMLKNAKYMPDYVSDKNAYQQTYSISVLKTAANKLDALLVTNGGQEIENQNLIQIASAVGISGGYIKTDAPSIAKGAYGQWNLPLSTFKLGNNGGHLATAFFYVNGKQDNDYLYRSKVNGHPELQRMNAAIDMNSNNINNVGSIDGVDVKLAGKADITGSLNAGNTTITGNTTTSGETYTGGWFRTTGDGGIYFQKFGGGWNMTDSSTIKAFGDKNIATGGSIQAGGNIAAGGTVSGNSVIGNTVTANGRLRSTEALQLDKVFTVGTGCAPNGLIGRDAVGATLSCQSGVWATSGKVVVINGYNPTCPANKIPVARYWTQAGGSNYGDYCSLQTGWAGVTTPSCESCANWEKCHMVYSQTWSATACS
ncbi:shufflon system plasmid conjugative transfer pilus tip adhesin PilV [Yersinia enterocolitica]